MEPEDYVPPPLNGNDAYAILGFVFDWADENGGRNDPSTLLKVLREAGYTPKMIENRGRR